MYKYKSFYLFQLFALTTTFATGAALLFVFKSLSATSLDFGLLAAFCAAANMIGFFAAGHYMDKHNSVNTILVARIGLMISSSLLLLLFLIDVKNLYVWISVAALSYFFGSFEIVSRPVFVIKYYQSLKVFNAVRNDLIMSGLAKILGFYVGGIESSNVVGIVFGADIVSSILLSAWTFKGFFTTAKNEDVSHIAKNNWKNIKDILKPLSPVLFFALSAEIITGCFIYTFNSQAVMVGKEFNIEFKNILVIASIGGIIFSSHIFHYISKNPKLFYTIMYILEMLFFLSFLLPLQNYVLIGVFINGIILSFSLILSRTLIYEGLEHNANKGKILAVFMILFGLSNIIGSLLLGGLIQALGVREGFAIFSVLFMLAYLLCLYYFRNEKLLTPKLR